MASDREQSDSDRSRRLLFADELAAGTLKPSQLARAEVRAATQSRRVPSPLSRRYQARLMRRGALGYENQTLARARAARRAVLGDGAAGPPRLLLRAGAFPHPLADEDPRRYGTDAFRAVHSALAESGVPYLIAVTPRVSQRPLDPRARGDRPLADDELELLGQLRREGVTFAAHGLDHRTRRRAPARRSELAGLNAKTLGERLDRAAAELAEAAIYPDVFVPPFDRYDWRQWDTLAARYSVVTAGHGSVHAVGFHDGPLWRGDAVWLPVYAPLEGLAATVRESVHRLADAQASVWAGVALDWSAEGDGSAVARLAREAAAWITDWEQFLTAVRASAVTPVSHLGSSP